MMSVNLRHGLLLAMAFAQPALASEELMDRSGCSSCHRIDQQLIGPAFREVAARYRADTSVAQRLVLKVREGGEGVWGDIPMQPNGVEKISDADLRTLVDWILSL